MSNDFLASKFGEDTPIFRETCALVQVVSESKVLRFPLEEATSRYPEMAASGLITKASYFSPGLEGALNDDPRIMYAFYKYFSAAFSFSLNPNAGTIQTFVFDVGKYFHETAPQGVSELQKVLFRFLLDNARLGYGLDLNTAALAQQLTENKQHFFLFFNTYFDLIRTSGDSFEEVWEVCRHYAAQIGAPRGYDMVWNNLTSFVHALVDRNRERLVEIRAIADQEQSDPALSLLYLQLQNKLQQEGAISPDEVVDWFAQEASRDKALMLLNETKIKDLTLKQRLRDMLMTTQLNEQHNLIRLKILLYLLEGVIAGEEAFRVQLLEDISAHFRDPELTDLSASLRILGGCKTEPMARYTILEEVLQMERFKPEYLANSIDIFFIVHRDISLFFRFMKAACLRSYAPMKVYKGLEDPIHMYRGEQLQDFEREAVQLCVESEGVCRLLGHELLFGNLQLEQRSSLTYDILRLDMLQQYKLVLSLLNQLRPVNHTIPILLPLLDSPSGIVRELLACKLEELIAAYRYDVIGQVKATMADDHLGKSALIARLEAVWEDLADMLEKKRVIKEFDPMLSETEKMRSYSRAQADSTRKVLRKSKAEHRGISSLFKTVQVARGGGSVMPDGSVQQMQSHSISYTMPRTMFITPERNDYEMQQLYSSNWDQEFKQWEQIILLSGNI